MWKHCMYEIMSDLGKYLVNRYALCLKGSNMPRPPLYMFLFVVMTSDLLFGLGLHLSVKIDLFNLILLISGKQCNT